MCANAVNLNALSVVCRELYEQFPQSISSVKDSYYSGVSYAGRLVCRGEESNLNMCPRILYNVRCFSGYAKFFCTRGDVYKKINNYAVLFW